MKTYADPLKWFKCKYCEQCFQGAGNFVRHKKKEHEHIYWKDKRLQEEARRNETASLFLTPLSPRIDETEMVTSTPKKSCCCTCKCSRNRDADGHNSEDTFFHFGDSNESSRLIPEVKGEHDDDPDVECIGVALNNDPTELSPPGAIVIPRVPRTQKHKPVNDTTFASRYSISTTNKSALNGRFGENSCYTPSQSPPDNSDRYFVQDDEEVVHPQQFRTRKRRHDAIYPEVQDEYAARGATGHRTSTASTFPTSRLSSKDAHLLTKVQRFPSRPPTDFEVACSSRHVPRAHPSADCSVNFPTGHDRSSLREENISCLGFSAPTAIPQLTLSPIVQDGPERDRHEQCHLEKDSSLELEQVLIDPSEVWSSKIPDDNLVIADYSPPPLNLVEADPVFIDSSERISSSEAQRLNLPLGPTQPSDFASDIPHFGSVTPIQIRSTSYLQSETPVMLEVSHHAPDTLSKSGLELIMNSYDEGDDSSPAANPLTPGLRMQSLVKEYLSSLSSSETSVLPVKDTAVNDVQSVLNAESVRIAEPTIFPTIGDIESVDGSIKTCLIFQTKGTEDSSKPEDASSYLASTSRRREITFSIPEDADVLTVAKLLLEIAQIEKTKRRQDQGHSKQESASQKANQESVGPEHKDTTPQVMTILNDGSNHQSFNKAIIVQSQTETAPNSSGLKSSCHQDESTITEVEAVIPETLTNTAENFAILPEPEAEHSYHVQSKTSAASIMQGTIPADDSVKPSSLEHVSASVVPPTCISEHAEAKSTPEPCSEFVSTKSVPEAIAYYSSPESDTPGTVLIDSPPEPISTQTSQSTICVTKSSISEPLLMPTNSVSSTPPSLNLESACINILSESSTHGQTLLDTGLITNGPADCGSRTKFGQLISAKNKLPTSISQLTPINSSPTSSSESLFEDTVQLDSAAAELDSNCSEEPSESNTSEPANLDSSFSDHNYAESRSSESSPADCESIPPSRLSSDTPRKKLACSGSEKTLKLIQVLDPDPPSPPTSNPSCAFPISENACPTSEPQAIKEVPGNLLKESSQSPPSHTQLIHSAPAHSPALLSEIQVPASCPQMSSLSLHHEAQQDVSSADVLLAPISRTKTDIHPLVLEPVKENETPRTSLSSNTATGSSQPDHHLRINQPTKRQHSEAQSNDALKTSENPTNFKQSPPLTSPRPKRKCTEEINYRSKTKKQSTRTFPNLSPLPLQQPSVSARVPNDTFVEIYRKKDPKLSHSCVRLERFDLEIKKSIAINQSSQGASPRKALTQIQPHDSHSQTEQTLIVAETEISGKMKESICELLENSSQSESSEEQRVIIEFPPAIVKPGVFRHYRRQERKLYKSQLAKSPNGKVIPIWEPETIPSVPFPFINDFDAMNWAFVYACNIPAPNELITTQSTLKTPSPKRSPSKSVQPDPLPQTLSKIQPAQLLKSPAAKSLPSSASKDPIDPEPSRRPSNKELNFIQPRFSNKGPSPCTLSCCRAFAAEMKDCKDNKVKSPKPKFSSLPTGSSSPGKFKSQIFCARVKPALKQKPRSQPKILPKSFTTSKQKTSPSSFTSFPRKICTNFSSSMKRKITYNNRTQRRYRSKEAYPPPPVLMKYQAAAYQVDDSSEDPADPINQLSSPENLPKLSQYIFPCRLCHQRLDNEQSFMEHELKHILEKPFKCRFCKTSFLMSHESHRHERIFHPELTEAPTPDDIFSIFRTEFT